MMRNRGNAWCAAVWLGLFDAQPVDYKDDEKIKEFIIAKYEKKRYHLAMYKVKLLFNWCFPGTMLTQVRPEFHEFHRPPQPLSNCRLQGLNLNNSSTSTLPPTSSRSSLASGSLIGSTLKARMDPSSQVWYTGNFDERR